MPAGADRVGLLGVANSLRSGPWRRFRHRPRGKRQSTTRPARAAAKSPAMTAGRRLARVNPNSRRSRPVAWPPRRTTGWCLSQIYRRGQTPARRRTAKRHRDASSRPSTSPRQLVHRRILAIPARASTAHTAASRRTGRRVRPGSCICRRQDGGPWPGEGCRLSLPNSRPADVAAASQKRDRQINCAFRSVGDDSN